MLTAVYPPLEDSYASVVFLDAATFTLKQSKKADSEYVNFQRGHFSSSPQVVEIDYYRDHHVLRKLATESHVHPVPRQELCVLFGSDSAKTNQWPTKIKVFPTVALPLPRLDGSPLLKRMLILIGSKRANIHDLMSAQKSEVLFKTVILLQDPPNHKIDGILCLHSSSSTSKDGVFIA